MKRLTMLLTAALLSIVFISCEKDKGAKKAEEEKEETTNNTSTNDDITKDDTTDYYAMVDIRYGEVGGSSGKKSYVETDFFTIRVEHSNESAFKDLLNKQKNVAFHNETLTNSGSAKLNLINQGDCMTYFDPINQNCISTRYTDDVGKYLIYFYYNSIKEQK